MSGRVYDSLNEAILEIGEWTELPKGECGCAFGLCTRVDAANGDHDWYEPSEPNLARADLPWFYFIPSIENLDGEFHKAYLKESQSLWGDQT